VPVFTGTRAFDNYDLNEIAEYIDWQPFFIAWELHGKFPQILTDEKVGKEATRLFNDAKTLLKQIIDEKWLTAKGVVGFWPANSNGKDTVTLLDEKDGMLEKSELQFLRQQIKKAADQPNLSLADFIAPADNSRQDFIGAFAVSIHGIEQHIEVFQNSFDDYNKIILQALADRLAEAFAELLHARTRKEFWGYAKDEHLETDELIKEKYQGIRPAPGYPACPDHTEKYTLFNLLDATNAAGITLTESLAMYPASSVCGWYFAHPESRYFGVGKIEKDQVEDYARRKNMPVEELERWLRPILEYDS
jgi:5-methyltetrahydrofolate--homocysteine methyltransferase